MHYLYGFQGETRKLVATFGSEQQLKSYVRWATLQQHADGTAKFEQGSALVGCRRWEASETPLSEENADAVPQNPSPSML